MFPNLRDHAFSPIFLMRFLISLRYTFNPFRTCHFFLNKGGPSTDGSLKDKLDGGAFESEVVSSS
jgi:hypothetical protein